MTAQKSNLIGLMLAFFMTSSVCIYAQEKVSTEVDTLLLQQHADTLFQKNKEFLEKVKDCIGVEEACIIQSKNIKIVMEWGHSEIKNEDGFITMRLDKKTGVYVAISLPKSETMQSASKKIRKSKEFKEERDARFAILDKVQSCFASENIRIIQAKDKDILKMWTEEELKDKDRVVCVKFDKETGIYTLMSKSKE